jgi:hypothetical protein
MQYYIPNQANTIFYDLVAKLDGSPIIVGIVNFYLLALSGDNIGKWFKSSDNSWQNTEASAGIASYKGGSQWQLEIAEEAWETGVQYSLYGRESGDLHIPYSIPIVEKAGDATLSNQATILSHLVDIKGVSWSTESLVALAEYAVSIQETIEDLIPYIPPLPAPSLSLETAKLLLQIADDDKNALISALLPIIEDIVSKYCGVTSAADLDVGSIFPIVGLVRYAMENPIGARSQIVGNDKTDYGEFPNALLKLLDNYKPDTIGGSANAEVINLTDINNNLGK